VVAIASTYLYGAAVSGEHPNSGDDVNTRGAAVPADHGVVAS
jgi:hypothetical protein